MADFFAKYGCDNSADLTLFFFVSSTGKGASCQTEWHPDPCRIRAQVPDGDLGSLFRSRDRRILSKDPIHGGLLRTNTNRYGHDL